MSEIFISYANEDRAKAKILSAAFEQQSWSVWWDRKIPPGKTFDEVISEALDTAKCVIVLWSEASVKSDWVKEEAAEGARRKILVPALIDDVKIPLGFKRIQAASLIDWQGESTHPEFKQLLNSVAQILGLSRKSFVPPTHDLFTPDKSLRRWGAVCVTVLIFFFSGSVVGGLLAVAANSEAMVWLGIIPIWFIGIRVTVKVWRGQKLNSVLKYFFYRFFKR